MARMILGKFGTIGSSPAHFVLSRLEYSFLYCKGNGNFMLVLWVGVERKKDAGERCSKGCIHGLHQQLKIGLHVTGYVGPKSMINSKNP